MINVKRLRGFFRGLGHSFALVSSAIALGVPEVDICYILHL